FGANVFRYLSSLDILAMASDDCSSFGFPRCWLDYVLACHMATLDACLNSLDQTAIRRLFDLAVWDAGYFGAAGHSILPAAPASLHRSTHCPDKGEPIRAQSSRSRESRTRRPTGT